METQAIKTKNKGENPLSTMQTKYKIYSNYLRFIL